MRFFREIKARWNEKMPKFWAKVYKVMLVLSVLEIGLIEVLGNFVVKNNLPTLYITFLQYMLAVTTTAALVAKLTVKDSNKLNEKIAGKGAALLLLLLVLPSCVTYKKCQDKFGSTVIDTAIVFWEHVVPKDSAVVRFRHDTIKTFQTIIERQGRATVIVEKLQDVYQVQAHCDSVVIHDTVRVAYEKTVFRPSETRWYKVWQNFVILGLAILLIWAVVKK